MYVDIVHNTYLDIQKYFNTNINIHAVNVACFISSINSLAAEICFGVLTIWNQGRTTVFIVYQFVNPILRFD